jgi:SprT protein
MITVNATIKAQVAAKVAECVAKIEARHVGIKMPHINIEYDLHSSRTSGQAIYSKHTVRFNPTILNLHTEKYLKTTVPHEVAHLAVRQVYGTGVKGHGNEWKHMMQVVLGAAPNRCSEYVIPAGVKLGKVMPKYHYKCSKCYKDYHVGGKIHGKIQRGSTYSCKCKGKIVIATTSAVQQKAAPAVPTPVTFPKTVPVYKKQHHAGMTKFDRCLAIYMTNLGKSRAYVISKFVNEVDMTAAGASTYYSNCAKANK